MEKNKGQCPQAKIKWPVVVQHTKGDVQGVTLNVTTERAFISCSKPLKLNEVVDMTINAPNRPLKAQAEVVWSNIYGHDDDITPRGMGVRFIRMSEEDRRLIAQELGQLDVGNVACEYLETLEIELGEN